MMIDKDYMGDSVYAEDQGQGSVLLTTDNGLGASNVIHLEQEVIQAFLRYLARMKLHENN